MGLIGVIIGFVVLRLLFEVLKDMIMVFAALVLVFILICCMI